MAATLVIYQSLHISIQFYAPVQCKIKLLANTLLVEKKKKIVKGVSNNNRFLIRLYWVFLLWLEYLCKNVAKHNSNKQKKIAQILSHIVT